MMSMRKESILNSNSHHSNLIKNKNNKGFTLSELLITVAILIILLAIGIPYIISYQKNLRQKELDAKAESIYVAVQNKITKLKASGDISKLKYGYSGNKVGRINDIPGDAAESDNIEKGSICYFVSTDRLTEGAACSRVVTHDIMDEELLDEHWVIEYNPESGIVYAVFYSEGDTNCAEEYQSDFNTYDMSLRYRDNRLSKGARVGYYGGGSASVSTVKKLEPQITVTNSEILYADIKCEMPAGITNTPVFKVEIKDTFGNAYTKYYTYGSENITDNTEKYEISRGIAKNGRYFSLRLTLDDLSSDATRFYNLYGKGSGHNADSYGTNLDEELVAGSDITITVTVSCPGNYKVIQNQTVDAVTNSLFDYTAERNSETTPNTAYIAKVRHLQNLDVTSGLNEPLSGSDGAIDCADIYYAKQTSDITFGDDDTFTDVNDWFETYSENYFNGIIDDEEFVAQANFKPISNTVLESYNGGYMLDGETEGYRINGLTEYGYKKCGLFETLGTSVNGNSQTVQNLVITGASIKSDEAGSVAGVIAAEVTGKARIIGCQVYLSETELHGKTNEDVWVRATEAGGLVGAVSPTGELEIITSSASTVVGGYISQTVKGKTVKTLITKNVGGLIARVSSGGKVEIDCSYADCYLVGEYGGGLVGQTPNNCDITINSCYAAGYITATKEGAGFVDGELKATDSYTILSRLDMEDDIDYYATAKIGTLNGHIYYSAPNYLTGSHDMVEKGSVMQISDFQTEKNGFTIDKMVKALGSAFTSSASTSKPYNLMDQGLVTYTYPALKDITHYGDWKAEFQVGALVYYEKYADGSYGFYGANVETTLKDDGEVVGDGYGIVYLLESASLPNKIQIEITDNSDKNWSIKTSIDVHKGEYYEVSSKSNDYKIYPLPLDVVNTDHVSANYYLKVAVKAHSEKDKEFYYFNPHFATTRNAKNIIYLTDENAKIPQLLTGSQVSIRTGRHLYNLSLYYPLYDSSTCKATFLQERNINFTKYEWTTFTEVEKAMEYMRPIGLDADGNCTEFQAIYDGQCYTISDLSFLTEKGNYVGFIAKNNNVIKNVVLVTDYDTTSSKKYYVQREGDIRGEIVYMGIIAGRNNAGARIDNCASAGYYLAGSDGTIHAYENSRCYFGAFVGCNAGTITNSSAACPAIRLSSTFADAYLAGFAGMNQGVIRDSYAIGYMQTSSVKGGKAYEAGFVANNTGRITDCYCAVALETSGDTATAYGFAPVGGVVRDCYYLNGGSYSYINTFYTYNNYMGVGESATLAELEAKAGTSKATKENSFSHINTNTSSGRENYPLRAVVKGKEGQYVHYGDWVDAEDLGFFGVYYWEKEEGGTNDGVHLTFIGQDMVNSKIIKGTSLCYAHDDGGKITSFGYGYFEKTPGTITTKTFKYCELSEGIENEPINEALHAQMSEYTFHSFTSRPSVDVDPATEDYFSTVVMTENVNGTDVERRYTYATWQFTGKIVYNKKTYSKNMTFYITPFFANAIKTTTAGNGDYTMECPAGFVTDFKGTPGTEAKNPLEVRSIDQLQYINWRADQYTALDSDSEQSSTNQCNKYYLFECNTRMNMAQTHDIESDDRNFAPLGRGGRSFNGTYNGYSYVLKNLKIHASKLNNYVGLFGQIGKGTILENIIMYAEEGKGIIENNFTVYSTYENNKTSYREATAGALVGMVYRGNGDPAIIRNCTAAGYKVVYNGNIWNNEAHINEMYYRYISIGGLCGSAYSATIINCSAANDIMVTTDVTKNKDDAGNARVDNTRHYREQLGGLVGSIGESPDKLGVKSVIQNCYTGGSITPLEGARSVLCGGIAGNASACNRYDTLEVYETSTLRARTYTETNIVNCYTYCKVARSYNDLCSCEPRPNMNGNNQRHKSPYNPATHYYDGYYYIACNILDSSNVENCYYLEYRDRPQASNVIDGSLVPVLGQSMTYEQMSDMETEEGLLYKLNGSTGSVTDYLNDGLNEITENIFTNVTTKEGKKNISINGKFSFNAGVSALEGKNYPFPVIIMQRDPTYGKIVHVHYGSWPVLSPYWLEGRSTMDIFKDMNFEGENEGYATKVFYLDPNYSAEELDLTNSTSYISDNNDIATVLGAEYVDSGEHAGCYAVTVKAVSRGTAHISVRNYPDITFTLAVTAELAIVPSVSSVEIAVDNSADVSFYAVTDKDSEETKTEDLSLDDIESWPENYVRYELNDSGEWSITPDTEETITCTKDDMYANIWTITRDGSGETTATVSYTLHYGHSKDSEDAAEHETDIVVTIPISVSQSYMVRFNNTKKPKAIEVRNTEDVIPGYQEPARDGWTLLGWYSSKDEDGVMVVAADGTLNLGVEGYTSDIGWNLTDNIDLYSKWMRETTIYVPSTEATAGEFDASTSYIILGVSGTENYLCGYDLEEGTVTRTVIELEEDLAGVEGYYTVNELDSLVKVMGYSITDDELSEGDTWSALDDALMNQGVVFNASDYLSEEEEAVFVIYKKINVSEIRFGE